MIFHVNLPYSISFLMYDIRCTIYVIYIRKLKPKINVSYFEPNLISLNVLTLSERFVCTQSGQLSWFSAS